MENADVLAMRRDAYSILERLPEWRLKELLSYLRSIDEPEDIEAVRKRKHEAFLRLEELRRSFPSMPDLDDEKELAEWREEKFGNH